LLDALTEARSITSHEALRRQKQLIGKLMRHEDLTEIERFLQGRAQKQFQETASLHRAETWRNRLVDDPTAWEEFVGKVALDRRAAMINTIEQARSHSLPNRYSRELFKMVREILGKTGL
jgi:ribosome-associated protein